MCSSHWVGQLNQITLVFDRAMQLPDCPHVFLWNMNTCSMEKYVPSMVRSDIQTLKDTNITTAAISAYEIWKQQEASTWFYEESKYYAERKAKEKQEENKQVKMKRDTLMQQGHEKLALHQVQFPEKLLERHRNSVEKSGHIYLGVRENNTPRRRRITHCYACKQRIDNTIDIECLACNWILCICGACGCGFQGQA